MATRCDLTRREPYARVPLLNGCAVVLLCGLGALGTLGFITASSSPALAQDGTLTDPALEGEELAEPSNPDEGNKKIRPFENGDGGEIDPDSARFNGTFTFACTPDLPGKMSLNMDQSKGITPIRLFAIIDDRTLSIPLRKSGANSYEASFPSPWKRFEYQLQFSTPDKRVFLSNRTAAKTNCRSTVQLAKILERAKASPAREKLLRDAVMLDDDIRRIEFVGRKLRELSLEIHRPSAE